MITKESNMKQLNGEIKIQTINKNMALLESKQNEEAKEMYDHCKEQIIALRNRRRN